MRTDASTTRAKPGVKATPMAMTMLRTPDPAVAIRISAIISTGMASRTSTTRMITALSQRGAVPAASPIATPATVATRTPSRLAISTGRAP